MFSGRRIKDRAQVLGVSYEDLKGQIDPLSKSFRDRYMAGDWSGCVEAIALQNRRLGLCPVEKVQDDSHDGAALLTTIRIMSPQLFDLVIQFLIKKQSTDSLVVDCRNSQPAHTEQCGDILRL